MSAEVVSLQAQVESVLKTLVTAATLELTKLFERRYRASARDVGHAEDKRPNETLDTLLAADKRRSIGVQVDEALYLQFELPGHPSISSSDFVAECKEEEQEAVVVLVVEEECLHPSADPLAEINGHVDPKWSPQKKQVLTETVDMVKLSALGTESPADSDSHTEDALHVYAETSRQSSLAEKKPLVILPDASDVTSGKRLKCVRPLVLNPKKPAPTPESLTKPVQAEPQQYYVSTARGATYSPSLYHGAVTPVWERVNAEKEKKDNLHMKLKLTCPDQNLLRPCTVQLVNVLTVPDSETICQDAATNHKSKWHLPKDLRRHQGFHTGHRLCCFSRCENGVWRLQGVVTHSRDGYTCSICEKTFKHRKILRRHERFHTGEKPYPCLQCSKTFALRKSLRRHLRFHTGERPHNCTHCGKSFRLRDNLKAHVRFHTREKPFSCSVCGKAFRIMRNLEKHKLSQCGSFVPSFRKIAGL